MWAWPEGEGEQRSKQTKRRTEGVKEKEAEQERSMGGNMNDLDSKKGERATAEESNGGRELGWGRYQQK